MTNKLRAANWLYDELKVLQSDPTFVAEDIILDITEQICEAMEQQGLQQKDLAERLGKSRSAVSQLLSGDQNVSIKRLVEVALALDMTFIPPQLIPFEPVEVERVDEGVHGAGVVTQELRSASETRALWSHAARKQPSASTPIISVKSLPSVTTSDTVNDYSEYKIAA